MLPCVVGWTLAEGATGLALAGESVGRWVVITEGTVGLVVIVDGATGAPDNVDGGSSGVGGGRRSVGRGVQCRFGSLWLDSKDSLLADFGSEVFGTFESLSFDESFALTLFFDFGLSFPPLPLLSHLLAGVGAAASQSS